MPWTSACRYAIGRDHAKHNLPCQDFARLIVHDDLIIGALADGAGSRKRSHQGALITVRTAIQTLESWSWPSEGLAEEEVTRRFKETFATVTGMLEAQGRMDDHPAGDLACTLVAFVATPEWLAGMSVGDSFLLFRGSDPDGYQMLFTQQEGEYANEATFITSPDASERLEIALRTEPISFVAASTDGLECIAVDQARWTPGPQFFGPFEDYLRSQRDDVSKFEDDLDDFLNSSRVNDRTGDDKALLMATFTT